MDLELLDQDVWERGVPYEAFAWLRRHDPVHWYEEPDGPGHWAITRHAHVKEISNDPARYSSWAGGVDRLDHETPEALEEFRTVLIAMDPPGHRSFRGLVSAVFTPRAITRLEETIRTIAVRHVERALEKGRIDFVTDYAAPVPMHTISDMMGVPPERRGKLIELSGGLVDDQDPEVAPTGNFRIQASAEIYALAQEVAAFERARPSGSLSQLLLSAEMDGRSLTDHEFDLFFLFLIVAGNETTRTSSSGALSLLLEHPEAMEKLRRNPGLLPKAIEETIRCWPPVLHMRRTATCDVELGGRTIRAGDKIVLWYPAANRDELVFPDAERFDIHRTKNEQLSFGFGEHFCLGAHLARLELQVMFEELLTRTKEILPIAPPRRLRSNLIQGVKEFRVELRPA